MSRYDLPIPSWTPEWAATLADRGATVTGQSLVWKPKRYYEVRYSDGTALAYLDSPSKVTSATEDAPGLTWWAAGLAADYLLDNFDAINDDRRLIGHLDRPGASLALPPDAREKWYKEARKQHDTRKDDAANIGTQVHAYIERCMQAEVFGRVWPTLRLDLDPLVLAGIEAFEAWWEEERLTVIGAEIPCCHPGLGYAGTIDLLAINPDGHTIIIDFKTSNAIRTGYFRQVSAYSLAWAALHPDEPIVEARIVRFGKEGEQAGKFEVANLSAADLDAGEQAFVSSLHLYRYTRSIEQRLKGK